MGASVSVLADLPRDGLHYDAFMEFADHEWSEDLFEANCNDMGMVPSQRALNLKVAKKYRDERRQGMGLSDWVARGDPLCSLIVAGCPIADIRKAGFVCKNGGLHLLEPLEVDWSMITEVDDSSLTLLHVAASQGYLEVAEVLCVKESLVDALDRRKWTPLHWACYKGHNDIAVMLGTMH